jgi:hypothetical protein
MSKLRQKQFHNLIHYNTQENNERLNLMLKRYRFVEMQIIHIEQEYEQYYLNEKCDV